MVICFTIGVDAVLSRKSGMTLIIAFGLILGLSSFFNKLDTNPSQVEVSSVSKCTELRMISEAWLNQVYSLTWCHLFCHDVWTHKKLRLWEGNINICRWRDWDNAYDTWWWLNQLYLFSLNPLYMQPVLPFSTHHMIYGNGKTPLMRNWHCVGWPGIIFSLKITRLDCDTTHHQHVNL